jgi:RNA polymerase sigma-32 factor
MKQGVDTLSPEQVAQVAETLRVKPEEVVEMETRLSGNDVALEGRTEDGEEDYAPITYLADAGAEPIEVLARRDYDRLQTEGIRAALETLDARSRRIVEARWLDEDPDGQVGTATLHDLAKEFRVSAERIRQIEAKALQKMKAGLAAYAS